MIVIYVLDERKDEDPESNILLVLGQLVSKILRVLHNQPAGNTHLDRVPRPVTAKFNKCLYHAINSDICHFFKTQGLPTDEQLDPLCRRATGFFVYAVAAVDFLDYRFQDPSDQLDVTPESTTYEGRANLKLYTSLDFLYTYARRSPTSMPFKSPPASRLSFRIIPQALWAGPPSL